LSVLGVSKKSEHFSHGINRLELQILVFALDGLAGPRKIKEKSEKQPARNYIA